MGRVISVRPSPLNLRASTIHKTSGDATVLYQIPGQEAVELTSTPVNVQADFTVFTARGSARVYVESSQS